MNISVRAVAVMIAALLPVAGLAQTAPDKPADSVRISGRVVFPDGNPVSVPVTIARIEGGFLTHGSSVITDVHGVFSLVVKPGYQYRIHLRGYGIKNQTTADTTSGKDLDVGDLVFDRCVLSGPLMGKPPTAHDLVGDLKPEQIIIEPQNGWWSAKMDLPESAYTESVGPGKDVDLPPCWTAPSLKNRKYWEPWPMIMLDRPVSIESFVGGKVKAIRVQYDPTLTPSQIRDEVRKVWLGLFTEAYSSIMWSEMNRWNIKASVEFEDGERTWILTDGIHVQVQDREGKYWFIRL